jgi:hypothetical protein
LQRPANEAQKKAKWQSQPRLPSGSRVCFDIHVPRDKRPSNEALNNDPEQLQFEQDDVPSFSTNGKERRQQSALDHFSFLAGMFAIVVLFLGRKRYPSNRHERPNAQDHNRSEASYRVHTLTFDTEGGQNVNWPAKRGGARDSTGSEYMHQERGGRPKRPGWLRRSKTSARLEAKSGLEPGRSEGQLGGDRRMLQRQKSVPYHVYRWQVKARFSNKNAQSPYMSLWNLHILESFYDIEYNESAGHDFAGKSKFRMKRGQHGSQMQGQGGPQPQPVPQLLGHRKSEPIFLTRGHAITTEGTRRDTVHNGHTAEGVDKVHEERVGSREVPAVGTKEEVAAAAGVTSAGFA